MKMNIVKDAQCPSVSVMPEQPVSWAMPKRCGACQRFRTGYGRSSIEYNVQARISALMGMHLQYNDILPRITASIVNPTMNISNKKTQVRGS
eukprot:CAMPEP_0115585040 /NCGR_PEP_ID=MMETSP0272-20121206/6992_1 /TAXON_ID=71861 /ORGANISM="Scrippsiella trochoidea, Strain CCMP3099" /LENGTH=91 /DNA_ID=CAMNT_0003020089 /DNA_START=398 /DNA_END=670 /DNA_ORIENTATION=+